MQLASDDNMFQTASADLPQRYAVSQTVVQCDYQAKWLCDLSKQRASGCLEINDLYPSSNSGDLEVTIEEVTVHNVALSSLILHYP